MRKAKEKDLQFNNKEYDLLEKERKLINLLYEYPKMVKDAGKEYSPALIANYLYELVKEYNQFYQGVPILKTENEEEQGFRLALSEMTGKVIKSATGLLGIEVPERM